MQQTDVRNFLDLEAEVDCDEDDNTVGDDVAESESTDFLSYCTNTYHFIGRT